MNREVRLVNGVIHNVAAWTVSEVNKLLYAWSVVVAERLGMMKERKGERQEKKEGGGRECSRGMISGGGRI